MLVSISTKFKIKHFFNQKVLFFFLISSQKLHSRYSLETLHWDASNESPQHMADDSHEMACIIYSKIKKHLVCHLLQSFMD